MLTTIDEHDKARCSIWSIFIFLSVFNFPRENRPTQSAKRNFCGRRKCWPKESAQVFFFFIFLFGIYKNTQKTRTNNKTLKTEKNDFSDEIGKQNEKKAKKKCCRKRNKIDVTKLYLVSRIVQNCTIETHQKGKAKRSALKSTVSRRDFSLRFTTKLFVTRGVEILNFHMESFPFFVYFGFSLLSIASTERRL